MANDFYAYFINNLGLATTTRPDMDTDTFKLVLIDHGTVTPAPATHDFYNDISAGAVGGLSTALGTKTFGTVARGVFDAADMTGAWTGLTGNSAESLSLLKDTGVAGTSDLLVYWDTGVTNLPFTPNGGDVNVTFNASGIFKI